VQWNIRVNGEGGVPFIWAHGLMGGITLDDATGYFHAKNRPEKVKIVRYDARGHGLSQGTLVPNDYHWSKLEEDMIAIADELRMEQFIAGGQSMGSMTALYAALIAPQRIKALILATPSTIWETRKAQSSFYNSSASIVELKGVERFVELLRKKPLLPEWLMMAKPFDNEKYMENILTMDAKFLPIILRGSSMSDLPPKDEFKAPVIPTLILAWPDDTAHPLQSAKELNSMLPRSRLIIAKGIDDLTKWPQIMYDFIMAIS
jgi:pimeloyl-ACP methyl ester carboxylesterase